MNDSADARAPSRLTPTGALGPWSWTLVKLQQQEMHTSPSSPLPALPLQLYTSRRCRAPDLARTGLGKASSKWPGHSSTGFYFSAGLLRTKGHVKVREETRGEVVHPPVDVDLLAEAPRLCHGLAEALDAGTDVLAHEVVERRALGERVAELDEGVKPGQEGVFGDGSVGGGRGRAERRLAPATCGVADDDNVRHPKVENGVVEHSVRRNIVTVELVGNVALLLACQQGMGRPPGRHRANWGQQTYVDEDVSGLGATDRSLGDARVGTAEPEHGGCLALRELGEELGGGGGGGGNPGLVAVNEGDECGERHGCDSGAEDKRPTELRAASL
ncbi:unnamed protein product [Cutaneotrichosporon oleaginosum]